MRCTAAGADLSQIFTLHEDEDFDTFRTCVQKLEQLIAIMPQLKLIVFDTHSDFLGDIDAHANVAIRRALKALRRMVVHHEGACVGTAHFRKSKERKSGDKLLDSVAFRNMPRQVNYLLHDPNDGGRRIFYQQKNNEGDKAPALALSIAAEPGQPFPSIAWESGMVSIDDIGKYVHAERASRPTQRDDAGAWILVRLADGPVSSAVILQEGEANGYSKRTLERAKVDHNIESKKINGEWHWVSRPPHRQTLEGGGVAVFPQPFTF